MNNIYNSTKWEQIKNKEIEINKSLPLQYLNPSNNDGYSDIDNSFYSLTGNKIDAKKIKHGNMQKFLKKNVWIFFSQKFLFSIFFSQNFHHFDN